MWAGAAVLQRGRPSKHWGQAPVRPASGLSRTVDETGRLPAGSRRACPRELWAGAAARSAAARSQVGGGALSEYPSHINCKWEYPCHRI